MTIRTTNSSHLIKAALWFAAMTVPLISGAAERRSSALPLARSLGVPIESFQAYVKSNSLLTVSEALIAEAPGREPSRALRGTLEKAQAAWLEGSIEKARRHFLRLAEMSYEADWREAQRQALFYSHFRLAQSAATALEREEWLERAIHFAEDLDPDRRLFPPPLISEFRDLRERVQVRARTLALSRFIPEDSVVFINGRQMSPDLEIRLLPGRHRITVYSDSYAPVSRTTTLAQLESDPTLLRSEPLVGGTCERSVLVNKPLPLKGFDALFDGDCVRSFTDRLDLIPKFADAKTSLLESESSVSRPTTPNLWPDKGDMTTKTVRRTWLWTGVSALAAGTVYVLYRELNKNSSDQNAARETTPVHHNGF